jgi:hypothetical protein
MAVVTEEVVVKFRVKEDVSVASQFGDDTVFKQGVHEAKDANREALEHLEVLGLAERVKSSDKEA